MPTAIGQHIDEKISNLVGGEKVEVPEIKKKGFPMSNYPSLGSYYSRPKVEFRFPPKNFGAFV